MVALPVPSFDSPERRQAEREDVSCQVVLHTSYARMKGMLTDLATGGARFVAELVPGAGVSALLEWDGRETLCRVVWSKDGACGLVFDRPISAHLVMHTAERKVRTEAAAVGKIPLARRRSGILRSPD